MFFGKKRLRGRRIAVLAVDGFELVELHVPVKAMRAEGAKVEIVSLHRGKIRGMNLAMPSGKVRVDREIAKADPDEYDGLFVPGGFINPDLLRQSREAREFTRAFELAKKPIATLCHGPWVLISAELAKGRKLTSWPGLRDDVVNAGGVWKDERVVRDGNWVSSRGPQDLDVFVKAMIRLFAGEPEAPSPSAAVDDISSRPYDRPPAMALEGARRSPRPSALVLLGAALALFAVGRLVSKRITIRVA